MSQLGRKSTKAQTSSNKSAPQKRDMSTRARLKEIVSLVMFEDEDNITDNYNMMEDVVVIDKWLDPIEIAVAAEKEFGLTEHEWPDEVFRSFGALLNHVENRLKTEIRFDHMESGKYPKSALKHPAITPSSPVGGR